MSGWLARSTAPGVTFAHDFTGDIGKHKFANGYDPVQMGFISQMSEGGRPFLRIVTPKSYGGANSAAFIFPFNRAWTSNSQHFGSEPFWVQWRMRVNAGRLMPHNPGGAWKMLNLAQYGIEPNTIGVSNTTAEIVANIRNNGNFPTAYHRKANGSYPGFETYIGGDAQGNQLYNLQPARDNGVDKPINERFCHQRSGPLYPGCWKLEADEVATFMVRVRYGTYGGSVGNEFDMWAAHQGATKWSHLVTARNFDLGHPQKESFGTFNGSNGGYLHTYDYGRTSGLADAIVDYGELIVSQATIPLPSDEIIVIPDPLPEEPSMATIDTVISKTTDALNEAYAVKGVPSLAQQLADAHAQVTTLQGKLAQALTLVDDAIAADSAADAAEAARLAALRAQIA